MQQFSFNHQAAVWNKAVYCGTLFGSLVSFQGRAQRSWKQKRNPDLKHCDSGSEFQILF